ncbi:MAG TPA: hypothetical protein PK746_06940, partial [Spirochaetales bacterium]|nr:hypothetical protein [Spirochaetales bacterium]
CIMMVFLSSTERNTAISSSQFVLLVAIGIPLAVLTSLFITFFTISRIFAYRFTGYLYIFIYLFSVFFAWYFLARLLPQFSRIDIIQSGKPLFAILPEYNQCIITLFELTQVSFFKALFSIAYSSLFFASFWGITRITPSRHLIGALLMPVIFLASLYLYGFIHSPLFLQFITETIKLKIEPEYFSYVSACIIILTALGFDMLFSYKPVGKKKTV